MAHRNYGYDVESGQARRLEPHVADRRHLGFLDDHNGRSRQRFQERADLVDGRGIHFGAAGAVVACPQFQVISGATVAAEDFFVEVNRFARFEVPTRIVRDRTQQSRWERGTTERENPRER